MGTTDTFTLIILLAGAGLAGLIVASLAFSHPRFGLYVLVALSLVGPAVLSTCSPSGYHETGLSLLPLQILLMGILTLRWWIDTGRVRVPLLFGLLMLVLLSGVSGLINAAPVTAWLQGTFLLIKSLWFLLICLGMQYSELDFRRCLLFVGGYAVLHIVAVAVQFALWPPVPQDWYCGLLGRSSTGIGAILMAYVFAYAYHLVRSHRKTMLGAGLMASTLIPVTIGSAVIGYALLPLIVVLSFIWERMLSRRSIHAFIMAFVSILAFAISLYGIVTLVLPNMPQGDIRGMVTRFLDPERLKSYLLSERPGEIAGRLQAPILVVTAVSEDPVTLLFGFGPGSMSQRSNFFVTAKTDARIEELAERTGGGGFGLERILAEVGLLGVGIVLGITTWLGYAFLRCSRRNNTLRGGLGYIACPVFVVFLVSLMYSNGWYTDVLWLVPFLLFAHQMRARPTQRNLHAPSSIRQSSGPS